MPNPEIEEFAKALIREVRDTAIQNCDRRARSNKATIIAKRWREAARGGDSKAIAHAMIPDVVDEALFCLLDAIDNGHLKLTFTASNGKQIDLEKDGLGELAGWHAGGEWREMYSKERFFDNFSDLK